MTRRLPTALIAVIGAAAIATGCGGGGPAASPLSGPGADGIATRSAADPPATAASSTTTTTIPATTTVAPSPAPLTAAGTGTPGAGVWRAAARLVDGEPAVYVTTLRMAGTEIGVSRMDPRHVHYALYAGTSQPAGSWPDDGSVAAAVQADLVATFNGGFQLDQARGGWYEDGRTAVPLVAGAASLVIMRNGSATVGEWGRDVTMSAAVAAVRQNLQLLVDHGAPTPAAASTDPIATWGDPLHEQVATWRSAVGVDASGALIYEAGDDLTPLALAQAMAAAGSERAMELDINPEWVSYDTFTGLGPTLGATKLLAGMYFPADHFLHPFWRDFVAAFVAP